MFRKRNYEMSRSFNDLIIVQWFTNRISIILTYTVHGVFITGVVSNCLNILISSRKRILDSTVGYYYICISIFNILSLISGWLRFYPESIGLGNVMLMSGKIIHF